MHFKSNFNLFSIRLSKLKSHITKIALGAVFSAMSVSTGIAQSPEDLAKQLSNPIASLISVPFQYNFDSNIGPSKGTVSTLNFQPVIPISINENWNLISRTIVPIKSQDNVFGASGTQFGIGDTVQSFFFSPKEPTANGLIWGVGPVIYIPTATENALGAGTWGGGATAVILKQSGPWTYGGLTNHIWSFGNSKINSTFVQPFISYTTPEAVTYALNTEATYDWNTNQWSIPINGMVSKIVNLGDQLASITGGVGYYAASTTNGPSGWRARLVLTLLFPK